MKLLSWILHLCNYMRFRKLRRFEEEFALLTDEGHHYACLHYYIDQRHQRQQLTRAGFSVVDVLDRNGSTLSEADAPTDSPWLMYVATRV